MFGYHNRYRPPYPYNPYGGSPYGGGYPGGYGGYGGGYGTNFIGNGGAGYGGKKKILKILKNFEFKNLI